MQTTRVSLDVFIDNLVNGIAMRLPLSVLPNEKLGTHSSKSWVHIKIVVGLSGGLVFWFVQVRR